MADVGRSSQEMIKSGLINAVRERTLMQGDVNLVQTRPLRSPSRKGKGSDGVRQVLWRLGNSSQDPYNQISGLRQRTNVGSGRVEGGPPEVEWGARL